MCLWREQGLRGQKRGYDYGGHYVSGNDGSLADDAVDPGHSCNSRYAFHASGSCDARPCASA